MTANVLSIFAFGTLGIGARYLGDLAMSRYLPTFPAGILLINVLGSFAAGVVSALALDRGVIGDALYLGLLVGFCGGFTTFSSYALQTVRMLERGEFSPALVYFVVSPILGLMAAYLGLRFGRSSLL